ncbi:MAG: hydroxylamine reductase [Planctomycetota bacterium]
MFCHQCQETVRNQGCTKRGVCGKEGPTADLMDLLVFALKGLALHAEKAGLSGPTGRDTGDLICKALFATITNANFDPDRINALTRETLAWRDALAQKNGSLKGAPDAAVWQPKNDGDYAAKAATVGIMATADPDIRSLRSLLLFGMKGIAAYTHHAAVFDAFDDAIHAFLVKGLAAMAREHTVAELTALVLEAGGVAVKAMALLDGANTQAYGNPEITTVSTGVRTNPGILISGHDLMDLEELLRQTEGTGVDVYTHSEMLPAHYYPAFKKFKHLAGNYGSSWWHQKEDFAAFNGPILMTTNCIVPVTDAYKDRIFTTGMAG